MECWNRNKIWIIGSLLLAGLAYIVNRVEPTELIGLLAQAAIVFLIFTLVPSNLLKLQLPWLKSLTLPLARLVKYRRDLGILAGLLMVAHAGLALLGANAMFKQNNMPFDWSMLTTKPVVGGMIMVIMIILLLLTSSRMATAALGKGWKLLHALVWTILPIAMAHAMLMTGEPSEFAIAGVVIVMVLILAQWWVQRSKPVPDTTYQRRAIFFLIGVALTIANYYWMQ